jgi:protein arginine kinase activator
MAIKCNEDNCDNEATVHLTEFRDGVKHEMHLCESCAAAKGLPGKSHFSIQQLLAGIASQGAALGAQKTRKGKEAACPGCGTTLSQFQGSGRFGCPECYTTFKDEVQNLVEKIHDSTQHCGKVPRRTSTEVTLQKDLRQLQTELKRAVRQEEYERAAQIRDQIKVLEERIETPPAPAPEEKPAPKAKRKSKPEE